MEARELEPGDVVQLRPSMENKMFGGCLLVVTEPKPWGCQGYVQCTGTDGEIGGQAYLRPRFADMEYVGRALWMAD